MASPMSSAPGRAGATGFVTPWRLEAVDVTF
jgi:hypothetical protein